jgi:SAM-dependent methyltransferase
MITRWVAVGKDRYRRVSCLMAEFNEVYARAGYYDIAFNRDIGREVDFIFGEYQRLNARPLRSLLEIACGPGYHARAFARQGVETFGLDLRPEMIDFARDKARGDGVDVHWIAADMRGFSLPHPVDAIITMYDSIDCLVDNDDIVEHFRTVAANLTPGGMYLYELTHPRDCSMHGYGTHVYSGERNGTKVEIRWAVNNPKHDAFTQVAEVETVLKVTENGNETLYRDKARERYLSPQELVALTKLAGGFKIIDCYGDFIPGLKMDNSPASRRMIFVLQKQS